MRCPAPRMAPDRDRHIGSLLPILRAGLFGTLGLLAACSTETLFRSNFDATPVGQPPAHVQQVGTANVFGPAGSVLVVSPPPGSSGNWVQIQRLNNQQDIAGMQGVLSQTRGPGQYNFLAAVYMPTGAGLATFQFEPANQPPNGLLSFLHLDLTQDNKVRIDDNDATKFGSFPRNQTFDVAVGLDTTASPPVAHISLLGANTSGTTTYTIQSAYSSLAQQFGAIRLWMGYPWTGAFEATDISVTHNTQ